MYVREKKTVILIHFNANQKKMHLKIEYYLMNHKSTVRLSL